MRLALVHDDLMQWGGAERLVAALMELWPAAPLYVACYDRQILPPSFPHQRLRTSFIQKIPLYKKFYQQLFFLHPLAFESFNFRDYDLVISSTTRFAKSIITSPNTFHLCYCNTPNRPLWFFHYYQSRRSSWGRRYLEKIFLPPLLGGLRVHDFIAAQRVDLFVANSRHIARRIKKIYHRRARVIYPFVDTERFQQPVAAAQIPSSLPRPRDFYLIVSRLSKAKRIDLAIKAVAKLKANLVIIGRGQEEKKLRQQARSIPGIYFLGWQPDSVITFYYQNCRALLYPQLEDFGITALEAQAAGRPVIAFRGGGALETVREGETGLFFAPATAEALAAAIKKAARIKFSPARCRAQAARFSRERFLKEFRTLVKEIMKERGSKKANK